MYFVRPVWFVMSPVRFVVIGGTFVVSLSNHEQAHLPFDKLRANGGACS